ncbi:endoglucanase 15 [Amborella trichopoda]|uniref:endoglucanase 15 n=1 Tax=Amborella trichopoda TaxID=13333 RepID=UPI0009C0282E|nr:endoglucanase 15 [Amborella trichopoda]|eukprot:XP_006843615.3 endoglucanase 15 [Amborella trichopoda]
MAFTVTMLAWSVVEYSNELQTSNELSHAMEAIRWGTDYFIKAQPKDTVLYAVVGDPILDHACWERPEDMTTSRQAYRIDEAHPGADLAGETAAALAASSMVFKSSDSTYALLLLDHAKRLFYFARDHRGVYSQTVGGYDLYASTDDKDEMLWAAAWLYRASGDPVFIDYMRHNEDNGGVKKYFSWDEKFPGVQALVSMFLLQGRVTEEPYWDAFRSNVETLLCQYIQKSGTSNARTTPGGLLWLNPWINLQYISTASFLLTVYSDFLSTARGGPRSLMCPAGQVQPSELLSFARSQVDYILGTNPKAVSYMVGYGSSYPWHVHHRGASIVSVKKDPTPVGCEDGLKIWFDNTGPDPNVIDGGVVGGPDENDAFGDNRSLMAQSQPAIYTTAPLVGVLAKLATMK